MRSSVGVGVDGESAADSHLKPIGNQISLEGFKKVQGESGAHRRRRFDQAKAKALRRLCDRSHRVTRVEYVDHILSGNRVAMVRNEGTPFVENEYP